MEGRVASVVSGSTEYMVAAGTILWVFLLRNTPDADWLSILHARKQRLPRLADHLDNSKLHRHHVGLAALHFENVRLPGTFPHASVTHSRVSFNNIRIINFSWYVK